MNINQIRDDIPFYGDKIFLNSAGSSLMPECISQAISDYLTKEEFYGGYKVAEEEADEIEGFYTATAQLLGCEPRNVAFAHDATDAYVKALSSIAFGPGDVIITTNDDYASNQIQFISLAQRYGTKTVRIKNLKNGDLDIEDFKRLVADHIPKLVAVTHIPTNSGKVQDVEAIGEICNQEGILYLVDACQSVGQIVVDVNTIKCDFLSVTGRKFLRGPRGTGLLYVSDKVLDDGLRPLYMDGKGGKWTRDEGFEVQINTAKRFETWEVPYALIMGLKEAVSYANKIGMEHISEYNSELSTRLRENLSQVYGVTMYDRGSNLCNLLTFRKEGRSLEELKKHLDGNQVYFSVSTIEWGLIDYKEKGIDGTIRLSPHYFNTMEEMDRVAAIIDAI